MRPFLTIFLLSLLLPSVRAGALPGGPAETFRLDQLKPGMKGEVWTVFRGREPEPFAVEITGVVRNALGPGKSIIVCELTDERVQKMGAVAGMSGSPLYVEGRVAGVLAYQLQRFETVRYAGFTPISDLLEISSLPAGREPSGPVALPLPRESSKPRFGDSGGWSPLLPVFTVSGLAPEAAAQLEPVFGALGLPLSGVAGAGLGGSADVPAPSALAPGDAVAVALAVGDINVSGTGTVSHVDGNRVLAFGHPMLRLGATELPMTSAEVVAILPSQLNSIKITNTGGVIGTFSQDRLSGVYGELGRQPQMVPVVVSFPGRASQRELKFSVIRNEQVLPGIAAAGLTQAIVGSNESDLGARGFRVTADITFPGYAPIRLTQLYSGPTGFAQGLGEFAKVLNQCLFNPFERLFPDRIGFRVEETAANPAASLESVQVSRAEAAPGDNLDVTIGWRGHQEQGSSLVVRIPVSREWTGKELEVVVAPGPTLDDLTGHPRVVPVARLRSFGEVVRAMEELRGTDGLRVAVIERATLFSDQLRATPEMPGSLERIARASDEARYARDVAFVPLWETTVLPDRLFSASARRQLKVTD